MARVTYAFLVLALAALVAGFFVHSALPLVASIGFSAVVVVLIMWGWARRIRRMTDDEDELGYVDEGDVGPGEERISDDFVVVDLDDTSETLLVAPVQASDQEPASETDFLPGSGPADEPPAKKKAPSKTNAKTKVKTKSKAQAKGKAQRKPKRASPRVVIVPGRDRYHDPFCRYAASDSAKEVTEAAARRRGLEPCSVCRPGSGFHDIDADL